MTTLLKESKKAATIRCNNCGVQLSSSTVTTRRGFTLCKVCREVEEVIHQLGEEEYNLKVRLDIANRAYESGDYRVKKQDIINLQLAIFDIKIQITESLDDYRFLSCNRGY